MKRYCILIWRFHSSPRLYFLEIIKNKLNNQDKLNNNVIRKKKLKKLIKIIIVNTIFKN